MLGGAAGTMRAGCCGGGFDGGSDGGTEGGGVTGGGGAEGGSSGGGGGGKGGSVGGAATVRLPQSVQSVPNEHEFPELEGPPSWQKPLPE